MKIDIQEPWWSAWQRFGWAQGIWGVGFNKKQIEAAILKKAQLIVNVVKMKTVYTVSPVTVKNYCQKNKTMFIARGNTLLYVIPHTLMKKGGE